MKKTTILIGLLISSFISFSQWQYGESENKFDDFQFKYASITGSGDFPYNSPGFAVRIIENKDAEFMLLSIAYTLVGSTIDLYVDNGKVYSFGLTVSDDHQTVWIDVAGYKDDILDILRNGNKLNVRIKGSNGSNIYTFPLNGSTAAINKVLKL
mgnify:CR=1 FL=1